MLRLTSSSFFSSNYFVPFAPCSTDPQTVEVTPATSIALFAVAQLYCPWCDSGEEASPDIDLQWSRTRGLDPAYTGQASPGRIKRCRLRSVVEASVARLYDKLE